MWVTDFGLARASARSRTDLTRHGAIMGTLDFIAPEQLDDRAIDGRADVYALGCVLFYALCGRVPYPRRNDAERMRAHALEPPPTLPLPELRAFDAVIAKAMAKRPEDRFQHAGELGAAAVAVARQAPSQPGVPSQHRPPSQTAAAARRPSAAAHAAATAGHTRPAATFVAGLGDPRRRGARRAARRPRRARRDRCARRR